MCKKIITLGNQLAFQLFANVETGNGFYGDSRAVVSLWIHQGVRAMIGTFRFSAVWPSVSDFLAR